MNAHGRATGIWLDGATTNFCQVTWIGVFGPFATGRFQVESEVIASPVNPTVFLLNLNI